MGNTLAILLVAVILGQGLDVSFEGGHAAIALLAFFCSLIGSIYKS